MADCRATYAQTFADLKDSVSNVEWNNIVNLLNGTNKVLGDRGIDYTQAIRDLHAGKASDASIELNRIIESSISEDAKNLARDSIRQVRNASSNIRNIERAKLLGKSYKGNSIVKALKGLRDLITSPAHGSASLENAIKATSRERVDVGFYGALEKKFGKQYYKAFDDPQFRDDFAQEFFNISRDEPASTKNKNAYDYAKVSVDALNEQRGWLNKASLNVSYRQLSLPIDFAWKRIQAVGRDDFVKELSQVLREKTHGDLSRRTALANDIFSSLERRHGVVDWEKIGDAHPVDEALRPERGYANEPTIEFENAAGWNAFNKKFGSEEFLSVLENRMRSWANKEAAIKTLGVDYRKNLDKLINAIQEGTPHGKQTVKTIQNEFERMMDFTPPEYNGAAKFLQTARALEAAAHTGFAPFAHVGVLTYMLTHGRATLNIPLFKTLGHLFSADKDAARRVGTISDHAMTHMSDSLGLDVNGADKSVTMMTKTADAIVRWNGLRWVFNTFKAASTGIIREAMTDHINANRKWNDLPVNFRANLAHFEITEPEWNLRILDKNNLNEHGLFDVYNLKNEDAAIKEGGLSLYDRLKAWHIDNVDSMVVTPGERDSTMAQLGTASGSVGNTIARALMQFKVYGFAIMRRVLYRTLTQAEDSSTRKLANIAVLAAIALPWSALVQQSKQVLQGNKPYKWDSAELWVRAFDVTGLGGVLFDQLKSSGVFDGILKDIGAQKGAREYSALFGPVFSDITKLLTHGFGAVSSGIGYELGDYSAKQQLHSHLSALTKEVLQTVPGQNLWYTMLVYHALIVDTLTNAIDPIGYRNTQRRNLNATKDRADSFFDQRTPLRNQGYLAQQLAPK